MNPNNDPSVRGSGGKKLFLSYTREDADALRPLREGVEVLHHTLWVDEKLEGGNPWWDDILAQIRACDAVIAAVSPRLLTSKASASEREYARRLHKPVIPVMVAPVNSDLLPADLTRIQVIDYHGDRNAPYRLATVLASLPDSPPLPDPLPAPPPVPKSYLQGLAEKIRQDELSLQEQLALVAELRAAVKDPHMRDRVYELVEELCTRHGPNLFRDPSRDIDELLHSKDSTQSANDHGGSHQTPPSNRGAAREYRNDGNDPRQTPDQPATGWSTSAGHVPQPNTAPQGESWGSDQGYPSQSIQDPRGGGWVAGPGLGSAALVRQPAPPQRLGLAITALILTFPLLCVPGLVALYFSGQVKTRWNSGDEQGAHKASRSSATVSWIGIGIIIFAVWGSAAGIV